MVDDGVDGAHSRIATAPSDGHGDEKGKTSPRWARHEKDGIMAELQVLM